MNKLLNWLATHRFFNVVLILLYFIAVVVPHKQFGNFLNKRVFVGITIDEYNTYVIIAALLLMIVYIIGFVFGTNKQPDVKKLWAYLISNTLFAIIIINVLFVVNIEAIHFPQYASLAIIVFPLIGNYTGALIWSTLLGVVDEAYQYFYLAPLDTSYFDFNDVVTDLVGAVFGLLLLRSIGMLPLSKFKLKRSSIWYGIGILIITVTLAHLSGLLSIYPNDDRSYHILRSWSPGFWSERVWTANYTITFHVIRPMEGIVITVLLWVFFSRLSPPAKG